MSGIAEALPSWRDTPTRQSIVDFVAAVTDAQSGEFVPEADRIALFDNDGTLWAESPCTPSWPSPWTERRSWGSLRPWKN